MWYPITVVFGCHFSAAVEKHIHRWVHMYVRMCSKETLLSGRMKRERTRTWARIGYLPTRGDWVEVYWPAWLCKCAGNFTSSHKQKTRNSVLIYQQFITHKRALYVGSNIRREFHQLSTDAESQFRNMITTDNGKLSIRTNRKTQQITWAVHDAPLFQSFCSMVANGKRFDAKSNARWAPNQLFDRLTQGPCVCVCKSAPI